MYNIHFLSFWNIIGPGVFMIHHLLHLPMNHHLEMNYQTKERWPLILTHLQVQIPQPQPLADNTI